MKNGTFKVKNFSFPAKFLSEFLSFSTKNQLFLTGRRPVKKRTALCIKIDVFLAKISDSGDKFVIFDLNGVHFRRNI